MYINCKSNSYQLRFSESFNSISNTASSKKDTVIDILSKHLDLSSIIPPEFHFSYNSNRGADRFYSLKSMLSALILQKILGFNKTSQLIDLLHISKEVRDFCSFDKVPNVSPVCAVREPSASYGKKSHTNQCALPASAWTGECAYLHGDSHTVNGLHIHSVLRSFILYKFQ